MPRLAGYSLVLAVLVAVAGVALVTYRSRVACEDAPLATVGDLSNVLTAVEVRELVARARMAGGAMTRKDALVDLLWQESQRQRLGLPGGDQARESRREVVLRHRDRLRDGQAKPLREDRNALPEGATLTKCGRRVMEGKE